MGNKPRDPDPRGGTWRACPCLGCCTVVMPPGRQLPGYPAFLRCLCWGLASWVCCEKPIVARAVRPRGPEQCERRNLLPGAPSRIRLLLLPHSGGAGAASGRDQHQALQLQDSSLPGQCRGRALLLVLIADGTSPVRSWFLPGMSPPVLASSNSFIRPGVPACRQGLSLFFCGITCLFPNSPHSPSALAGVPARFPQASPGIRQDCFLPLGLRPFRLLGAELSQSPTGLSQVVQLPDQFGSGQNPLGCG